MSLTKHSNICRSCLSQSVSTKSIFSVEEIMKQQITLSDMLMACASIRISKNDGLPDNICLNCTEDLHKAFLFKRMCESSDITLRNCPQSISISEIRDVKSDILVNDSKTANQTSNLSCKEHPDDSASSRSSDENNESKTGNIKTETKIQEYGRKKKSYKCDECSDECLGLAAYWKHMASVHGKNFKCEICDKQFKTQSLLTTHRMSYHKEDKVKNYRKNKTGITKKRNLPRTCEICNKTFRFHSNLERHKLIHTGEKPYLCNVCGKGFGQMSYLKIHSFIHTGEKPYKCQMCDKSFAAPGTLMTHVRIHTGERPHVCKICGKDFPQSGYLSAHIRTHTGEKPVECKVCHRRFNQSGRLVIHMRIHSGEKPYTCKECGRSFAVRGTLKKHIRTHTGERPYVCSVCGQAFAQSGTLATHMKVHRPKQ